MEFPQSMTLTMDILTLNFLNQFMCFLKNINFFSENLKSHGRSCLFKVNEFNSMS